MDATYLVFMLTFAASIRGIQSAEVKDVDQAAEEKVPIIVDKTSTMIRNPRIFFPLTTSTKTATATGSVTLCMVTQSTGLTACGRKRRMVTMDGDEDADVTKIRPSLIEPALDGEEAACGFDALCKFWVSCLKKNPSNLFNKSF